MLRWCQAWKISFSGIGKWKKSKNEIFQACPLIRAVGYLKDVKTFYAGIWTNASGIPGAQVLNAYWGNLTSNTSFGDCCGLVTTGGISGVSLAAGQQYFMILGPMDINDASWNPWNLNNQVITGLDLYSTDGGLSWVSNGSGTLDAFDILGGGGAPVPEPTSLLLLGTGLGTLALAAWRRRK